MRSESVEMSLHILQRCACPCTSGTVLEALGMPASHALRSPTKRLSARAEILLKSMQIFGKESSFQPSLDGDDFGSLANLRQVATM